MTFSETSGSATMCAGDSRENHVFTSETNSVKVILHTNAGDVGDAEDKEINFILHYKGKSWCILFQFATSYLTISI